MNSATLLHRQVNPIWQQNGQLTSQVFSPTPKDGKMLSVYDGDQISPEESWQHFTEALGFQSIGAVSVTVEECEGQKLPVIPDPDPFDEHVLIDFQEFGASQIKKKAKRLKSLAEERGWQYQMASKNDAN